MPSQQEETTFCLSFGGVDFCLAPSAVHDAARSDIMSISKICAGEVWINLNNFVGTLRVKHPTMMTVPSNSALPTTESLTGKENVEDGMSIDIAEGAEASNAAVVAPATEAPNPVEDTPSPQAKGHEEGEPSEKLKQRKGQQKLNFFGEKGKKKKSVASMQKNMINNGSTASKRSPMNQAHEPASTKKQRKGSKTSEQEQSPYALDFNDIIDTEAEEKSDTGNNESSFTLGQSMPSQDDDPSLDSQREKLTIEYESPKSNPKEGGTSDVSKMPAQVTSAPCPRWGHTMNMIDHKRFIVYGGQSIGQDSAKPLSDLFVYDLMDHKWTQPINCKGVARTWHTANFLPERQLLLCFGGDILCEKTGKLISTDQVMVLDCEIMLWYPPTVSGQVPSGRSGHASCILPETNSLVVFGGVKNGRWLNSCSILDTNRWKWNTLKTIGDAPRPRSYHSAIAISSNGSSQAENQVVIFGGNNGSKCFNGVHVLESMGGGKKWVWSNPKTKGESPRPRTGHNAMLLSDGFTILVYGGWDPNEEDDLIFGDSFLLNTKTWTWRKGPKPKYEKSMNKMANGGAARVGHSAVLAPGSNGVQVLALGGRVSENKFVGDFQSLVVPL